MLWWQCHALIGQGKGRERQQRKETITSFFPLNNVISYTNTLHKLEEPNGLSVVLPT